VIFTLLKVYEPLTSGTHPLVPSEESLKAAPVGNVVFIVSFAKSLEPPFVSVTTNDE
jgi:hypothetical protein